MTLHIGMASLKPERRGMEGIGSGKDGSRNEQTLKYGIPFENKMMIRVNLVIGEGRVMKTSFQSIIYFHGAKEDQMRAGIS
jgi:hypothetical protein